MWTLNDFYHSKEWQRFREIVIAERTAPDGFVYDEETGKPITRKYDIILHHKVFLTEENVNDRSISLNPHNIEIVSAATHNRIHNKLGFTRKEVYLIYGSPCSGKSSYLSTVLGRGDLVLEVDRIRQCVSGLGIYDIVPGLNSVIFGIRDLVYDAIVTRRGKWNRAYIVGGYPSASERERICRETGAIETFIDTPEAECLARLERDPDGRNLEEWRKFIEDWWRKYSPSQG